MGLLNSRLRKKIVGMEGEDPGLLSRERVPAPVAAPVAAPAQDPGAVWRMLFPDESAFTPAPVAPDPALASWNALVGREPDNKPAEVKPPPPNLPPEWIAPGSVTQNHFTNNDTANAYAVDPNYIVSELYASGDLGKLGYQGPLNPMVMGVQAAEDPANQGLAPELQQWLKDKQLQPAQSKEQFQGALLTPQGDVVAKTNMRDFNPSWSEFLAPIAAAVGANFLLPAAGAGAIGAPDALGLMGLDAAAFPALPAAEQAALAASAGSAMAPAALGSMALDAAAFPALPAAEQAALANAAGQSAFPAITANALQTPPVTPDMMPAISPVEQSALASTANLPITPAINPNSNPLDERLAQGAVTPAPAPPVNPLTQLTDWAKANPEMGRLLFAGAGGLLSAAGGGGSNGGGGYVDSGWRPNLSNNGGWQAQVAPRKGQAPAPRPGLGLAALPTTGNANSGMWRYLLNQGN